jgi:hypothetical protein
MVVFIDPKQSYVEIIQNIGRISRKNVNTKQNATILIPTFVDTTKYKNCKSIEEKDQVIRNEMSKTGDFNGILNVLSAIRQEDPYLFELCLKYPDIYTQKEISSNLKKYNLKLDLVLDPKTNLEPNIEPNQNQTYSIVELFDQYKIKYNEKKTQIENFTNFSSSSNSNVQVISNKILEDDIYIGSDFKDTIYFVKTNDDKYIKTIPIDQDSQKIKISDKIPKPNRNIKPITHINDEIKVLWEIDTDINLNKKVFGGYIKSVVQTQTEEEWIGKLNEIKNYINLHGYKPSSTDKNGRWLFKQKKLYGKKLGIFKKYKKIILEWEKFVDEYKKYFKSNEEVWMEKLEQVKSYINLNDRKPSILDANTEIKHLGAWIGAQQQNYKKKKEIMSNENIRIQWEKFVDEYKKYFKSNEEVWVEKLEQVKSYINIYLKRPSGRDANTEIKQLGTWLQDQQKKYIKKKFIMSDENIRSQWEKFIDEYKKYFKSNEEEWIEKLEETKGYINTYNKRPSGRDANTEIKQLGYWLQHQQTNYIKKENIMKNENICSQWEKFIKDYEKYFKSENNEEKPNELEEIIKSSIKPSIKSVIVKEKQKPNELEELEELDKQIEQINKEIIKHDRKLSGYQELTKKMSIQNSNTTNKMFKENKSLWEEYHNLRDYSFKGYKEQDEIPVNKIIKYLETKSNIKLKILDLGCGRNLIYLHFKSNNKFEIVGYDHVESNGSKSCDISKLNELAESIDICVFSQSLMGSNWKEYINEALRVLRYNGEIIISESIERYELIKNYIQQLKLYIKFDMYEPTKRWFYLHIINDIH